MQKYLRYLQNFLILILFSSGLTILSSQKASAAKINLVTPDNSSNSCGNLNIGFQDYTLSDISNHRDINPEAGWLMDNSSDSPSVYSCMDFNLSQCPGSIIKTVTLSARYSLGDGYDGQHFDGENGFMFGLLVGGQTLSLNYSGPYIFTNLEPLVGSDGMLPPASSPDVFEKTFQVGQSASSFSVAMFNIEPQDVAPALLDNLVVSVDYDDSSCIKAVNSTPTAPKTGLAEPSSLVLILSLLILPAATLLVRMMT